MSKPVFPSVVITAVDGDMQPVLDAMSAATVEWTYRAARGECSWVCSDCCDSFPDGMPDECAHGHASCTEIIQRDKRDARKTEAE